MGPLHWSLIGPSPLVSDRKKEEVDVCYARIEAIFYEADKGAPDHLHAFPKWGDPFA